MFGSLPEISAEDFDREVLQSTRNVVVAVMGYGCRACKMILPVLETLVHKFEGRNYKPKFFVLNIGIRAHDKLFRNLGGRGGIPTLMFFSDGQKASNDLIGFHEEMDIKFWITRSVDSLRNNASKPKVRFLLDEVSPK
jgi:thioredoxin-like negative regulator of GroEL